MENLKQDIVGFGIREYTDEELNIITTSLIKQIPTKFGDYINISDLVVTSRDNKDKSLFCSLGGTNWIISFVEIKNNKIVVTKLAEKSFHLTSEKHFFSFDSFIEEIEILIEKSMLKIKTLDVETINIAMAFPVKITKTNLGIDAKFKHKTLPKGWNIDFEDGDEDKYIGETLLKKLNQKIYNHFSEINILNDVYTIGLRHRLGFIFGTGVNALCEINGKLWNTEVGKSKLPKEIIKTDKLFKKQLILNNRKNTNQTPIIEYMIGGEYLLQRFALSLKYLINEGYKLQPQLAKQFETLETSIISDFANPQFGMKDLSNSHFIKYITNYEFKILKEISSKMFIQTSQLIGSIIASIVIKSTLKSTTDIVFGIDGSVFNYGYGIKDRSIDVAESILSKHGMKVKLTFENIRPEVELFLLKLK